jgi:hypothetical protein
MDVLSHRSPAELIVLASIILSFVTFGIVLLCVSISTGLAARAELKTATPTVKVTPARRAVSVG